MKLSEVKGDLFSCEATVGLAHCISKDIRMGKGIATLFKNKFGGIDSLKQQVEVGGIDVGGVAVLQRSQRYVYYLITKSLYWQKPTYESLQDSLGAMRRHLEDNKVMHVAIPRIGCGLDGLQWEKVKIIIENVFGDSDIQITVYSL